MSGVDAGSFFPTAGEVVRAVQFVRENPAVALGVVVGIASLSIANYYEEEDDIELDDPLIVAACEAADYKSAADCSAPELNKPKTTSEETMSLTDSLAAMDVAAPVAPRPSGLLKSSKTRSSLVDISDGVIEQEPTTTESMQRSCSFCNNPEEASSRECCDPDWGWFIPTSPEDHDGHHHHHDPKHAA